LHVEEPAQTLLCIRKLWYRCSVVNKVERDGAFCSDILQETFNDSNELKVQKTDVTYILATFNFLLQSVTSWKRPQTCWKQYNKSMTFKINWTKSVASTHVSGKKEVLSPSSFRMY
jgi:hypothetical protein